MTAYIRYLAPDATGHTDAATAGDGGARWGVVEDEVLADGIIEGSMVEELAAPPFGGEVRTGNRMPLDELHLLAPATPSKVIAVGLNYRSHLDNSPIGTRPQPTDPPCSPSCRVRSSGRAPRSRFPRTRKSSTRKEKSSS